jgi:hypothetical protein
MSKSEDNPRRGTWILITRLGKGTLAVVGAVGLVVGAVMGVKQLVDWLSSVREDPIRASYSYVNYPAEGVIVGEFDPGADPQRYLRDGRVASSYPYVYVEVTSQAEQEAVTLSPYLVVEVTDVRPMPERPKYVAYPAGAGGAQLRVFTATLSPERERIFYAPQWTPETTLKPGPPGYRPEVQDTFTLTPGNKEFLLLELTMLPGYYYNVRVGVQYSYKDEQRVEWSEKEQVVGVPSEARVWRQVVSGSSLVEFGSLQRYEEYKKQNNIPLLPRYDKDEVQIAIERQNTTVQEYGYPYIPPEQVGGPGES